MRQTLANTQPPSDVQILMVDDNEEGLIARQYILIEHFQYPIHTASSAEEGLAILQNQSIHLVITDYQMPGINGKEFIQQIRNIRPATKIILVTGFANPLGLTVKSTGADVVIQKSSQEVPALIRAVQRCLRPAKKGPGSSPPPASEEHLAS